ncbi:cytochrome P450 [Kitasatospora sp. NPDC018619]|uniref:cytochrome P450 n=1 Tax=unclassified Kitasatospora TaxID=2633591 RepID=UPI0037ACF612
MSTGTAGDLTDPGLYSRGEPHEVWRRLRAHDPVHWQPDSERRGGYWVVTRYADVERVLHDYSAFTSERGTLLNLLGRGDPAAGQQLAATDPPHHDRARIPLKQALAVKPLASFADRIQAGIRELLAPGADGRPFDFAVAMARLPLVALSPILGLPPEDHERLIRLAMMSTAEEDPEFQLPGGVEPTLKRGHREIFAYFSDLVRARLRNPGDDLISVLAETEVDGEPISTASVISNCYSMLLGSAGTLPHVPIAAVVELAGSPRYADWAAHPELLDSGIEEALRWATPASNFMRYALQPVELSGVRIAEGDAVVAYLASANRDAEVFPDPDVFDIRRRPNRHLAFGVGHHYCVGSHLARLALRLLFTELFATFSSIEVVGEIERMHSTFLAGFKRVPVAGVPRRATAKG